MLSYPRLNGRLVQVLIGAAVLTALLWTYLTSSFGSPVQQRPHFKEVVLEERPHHPIDDLLEQADQDYKNLLAKETHDVQAAVRAYESRRGRRPPPGFDLWFKFAKNHDAVIVEDFFDRIYHDLNPFWAIPALQIRQQANNFIHRISVRDGTAKQRSDIDRDWMFLWEDLVGSISEFLPDLDMAINEMDESRLIVPWETIDGYMQVEQSNRSIIPESQVITHYTKTAVENEAEVPHFEPEFTGYGPYWDHAVIGCPPDSPARASYSPESDFSTPPPLPSDRPEHSHAGFVSNWTLTKSPCDNPTLQGLHGTFVEPISISNSKKLFPLFGGSKLPMNNEILLPPAMYWTDNPFYSGGKSHGDPWKEKHDKLVWRGAASGGRNKLENWTRFQRHRFVAMVNGTSVKQAETSDQQPPNFELPTYPSYRLQATQVGFLGDWLNEITDAGFVHLLCFPDPDPPRCSYTDPWYKVAKGMQMKDQYAYKYLPDIDGNSFSGRYRGFLGSTSLPIKATIYDEWHDSRVIPWKHFVPMDNTFIDIYGILEYFLGYGGRNSRDDVAERIATEGKEWTEKVLRREDMQVYVLRLLLEYARICDDNRERLGYLAPVQQA